MDQISELVARVATSNVVKGSLKPPPGVKPNFVNPETRAPSLINANIAMMVLGSIALLARLYARAFLSRSLGWDDYTAVAALLQQSYKLMLDWEDINGMFLSPGFLLAGWWYENL
ncbi:MAG: hypothetical protein M1836_006461 [Candelina mexicana]|nr:MAG: hypothetical protein M1836_006461 [Candelina mexicana]